MMRIKQLINYLIPILVLGTGILFIIFINLRTSNKTDRNGDTGKQNNTYLRIIACVSSRSPSQRTSDYVKGCYDKAEAHNNIKVERFGDGL